jgi:opacity protein-like surface antigen
MRKVIFFAVMGIVVLLGGKAFAQDQPTKIEMGLDYSLADFNPRIPGTSSQVLNGGGGSVVYFLMPSFGLKMDLQGYTNSQQNFVIPPPAVMVTNPIAGAGQSASFQGGTFHVGGNLFTYMFGPEIKKRGRIEPYGQLLIGGAHSNTYANLFTATRATGVAPDNNAFALTVGFGLDFHINKAWSIRPVEVGYLLTEFGNPFTGAKTQNSFRYAAGINFNFK